MKRKVESNGEDESDTGEEGIKNDEGYFSRHYLEALKAWKNPSQVNVESTYETSYETTLPLQVQVKSVVVVPTRQAAPRKPTGSLKPPVSKPRPPRRGSKTTKSAKTTMTQRPVVFDTAEDYVDSVHRHMEENMGTSQDVMTELRNLMARVSEQGSGASGWQLQHPFTRRNYQRRFGNTTPMMSLDEWQTQNDKEYKRFPEIFERSPVQSPKLNPNESGGQQARTDLTIPTSKEEQDEYLRWKKEREEIDRERVARHKNSKGQWRRAWDMDKTENM